MAVLAADAARQDGGAATRSWDPELIECYQTYSGPLAGYVLALVGDASLAQDIAQEAFVRMFARWRHIRHPKAYVYLVATNLVRMHWRQRGRESAANASVHRCAPQTVGAPDPWLRDLVDRLPERLRVSVLLHYYADLPVDEVARQLKLPAGTVKRRLHEARALLQELAADDA